MEVYDVSMMEGEPFRVIVAGGMHVTKKEAAQICSILDITCRSQLAAGREVVIVHGHNPRGVEPIVDQWACTTEGAYPERHPANKAFYGSGAESRRNAHMAILGAHLCLAFPNVASKTVWDCVEKAARCGISSRVYPIGPKDPPYYGPRRKRD